jgi:O-antigen/teichoic acid export membrane protein
MLVGVTAVVLVAGGIAWRLVDWPAVFNVRSPEAVAEVGPAMGLAFLLFCLAFPLSVVDRVLVSFQQGATANAWAMIGSAATLGSVLVAARTRGGMLALVAALAGAPLVVKAVAAAWLFFSRRPAFRPGWSAASRDTSVRLLRHGSTFFVQQVAALVLLSTDNIIIARVLGAEKVTPYSVTWSLLGLTQVLTMAAFPYLWAAYGEALARGDDAWVVRMLGRSLLVGTAATALLLVPLTLLGQPIIRMWAGAAAVPPTALLWWMAAWDLLLTPAQAVAAFLNASGRAGVQAVTGIVTAVANVALSVLLARRHGIEGVIAATVVTFAVLSAVPIAVVTVRAVRGMRARSAPGA